MKKTIDFNDFKNEFRLYGRENQFSKNALKAIFDYIESFEQDCGEEIELDVIAICCDYQELEIDEALKQYDAESVEELTNDYTVIYSDEEIVVILE